MKRILYLLILFGTFAACKKEIDFEYHDMVPIVVIEGRVSNEGTTVVVTQSRPMADSVKGRCLPGAEVVVTVNGVDVPLAYDETSECYRSSLTGVPGQTYHLTVVFQGQRYEATSTMPPAAPVLSAEFLWQSIVSERLLVFEVWASDPNPDERNYYWYRMDRRSAHPLVQAHHSTEPYRWAVFDDRGNPPGLLYRDVMCTSERQMDEDDPDDWKSLLYEGDTITFCLMTIDRSTYDYFASLRTGQSGGANPHSNITGGCQGYFTATSVTYSDTVVFRKAQITQQATFRWQ